MQTRVVRQIGDVDREAWDALDHGGSPFLAHGFLAALEETGSTGRRSGWDPRYLLIERGGQLVGAAAAFVKAHSYGEFIFDWDWAHASQRAGLDYYPKLVLAAPHTPATGPRLLVRADLEDGDRRAAAGALVAAASTLASLEDCSSIHVLFLTWAESDLFAELGFARRASFQFHWHNRGYRDFADFLDRMTSRRRKQVRKERSRARAGVDAIELLSGAELTAAHLAEMDRFYRDNVDAHGGTAYLRPGFFAALHRRSPGLMLMARAIRGGRAVAGALFLETERALYGRYWGCDENIPLLHFEMACYVGIERAIERGLALFEAGAQGSHKLLRGFEPSPTHSVHLLFHPALDRAVRHFLGDEEAAVERQIRRLERFGPFKECAEPPGVAVPPAVPSRSDRAEPLRGPPTVQLRSDRAEPVRDDEAQDGEVGEVADASEASEAREVADASEASEARERARGRDRDPLA